MIGTPTSKDSSFILDSNALQYLHKFKPRKAKDLHAHFPKVHPEGVKLLKSLLQFNPYFRPTAEQALQSPYFDEVRSHNRIKKAKTQVNLEIENRALTVDSVR